MTRPVVDRFIHTSTAKPVEGLIVLCADQSNVGRLLGFCRYYGMHVVPCRPSMPQKVYSTGSSWVTSGPTALKGRRTFRKA